MTPIEVIAAIAAFAVLAKMVLWLCCPRVLVDWGKSVLKQPELLLVVYGLLTVILSYFILQAIGIVPVMACIFLAAALFKLSFVPYFSAFSKVLDGLPKTTGGVFAKSWFAILVLCFLSVWTLYAVFG